MERITRRDWSKYGFYDKETPILGARRGYELYQRLGRYEDVGTPEECRAAVEKQTAKLVIDNTPTEDSVWYQCPTCKGDLTTIRGFYCQYCGQKLHWR